MLESIFRSKSNVDELRVRTTYRDVYAFDQFALFPINSIPAFSPGSEQLPLSYIFLRDPHYKGPNQYRDWGGLPLTLCKLAEFGVLNGLGAGHLSWVSGLNWFYFFMWAALLQHMQLSRGYGKDFSINGSLDVISSELPNAKSPGGGGRILLGVPGNFRHHMLWRLMWIGAAIVCPATLVFCYLLLASCPARAVYAWMGFQVFWLLCRFAFFHLAEGADNIVYPILQGESWERLGPPLEEACARSPRRIVQVSNACASEGKLLVSRGHHGCRCHPGLAFPVHHHARMPVGPDFDTRRRGRFDLPRHRRRHSHFECLLALRF
jgi:hypothetical protein